MNFFVAVCVVYWLVSIRIAVGAYRLERNTGSDWQQSALVAILVLITWPVAVWKGELP